MVELCDRDLRRERAKMMEEEVIYYRWDEWLKQNICRETKVERKEDTVRLALTMIDTRSANGC